MPEPAKPEFAYEPVEPSGRFSLIFNEGMAGMTILEQIEVEIKTQGQISALFADDIIDETADTRRLSYQRELAEEKEIIAPQSGFDLSKYMSFDLRRGDEDSAEADKLGFEVIIDELAGDRLYFKLQFENPTMVSIGTKSDVMVGTILDESFFCSADTPMTIEEGTEIRVVLPKLLPGEEFETMMVTAEE